MGFMDKIRGRKDDDLLGGEDPFGSGGQGSAGPGDDPLGQDSGLNMPGDEPFGSSSQPAPGLSPMDYSNPDLNAVKGIARPKDPYDRQETSASFGQPGSTGGGVEKDLQIIIAKLDAVKSELDSLHQRVQRIERLALDDQQKSEKQRLYGRW